MLRKQNGITLIALVITIIVLLILAGVSIAMVLGDNGVLSNANKAKVEQVHGEVSEGLMLEYADYQTAVHVDDIDDTFFEYLNDKGYIDLSTNIIDVNTMTGKTLSLGNGSGDKDVYKLVEKEGYYRFIYYNEDGTEKVLWNAKVAGESDDSAGIILVSELVAGDYITYVDAEGNEIPCMVLYDSTSEYGVQIISLSSVANVTLGGTDIDSAAESYNNAIVTLNNKAQDYLNEEIASSARCMGSVPNNPTYENEEYYETSITSYAEYTGKFKSEDSNYISDYNQTANLDIDSSNCWFASRFIGTDYTSAGSYIVAALYINPSWEKWSDSPDGAFVLYSEYYNHKVIEEITNGFRPVFTLRSDAIIVGGDGSADLPYYFQ